MADIPHGVLAAFPSYKRAKVVKTFQHIQMGQVVCFVEPCEYDTYYLENKGHLLETYPQNSWNISKKRKWIVDYAIKNKVEWLLMLEDDLTGLLVRDGVTAGGHPKLVKSDIGTVVKMMLRCAKKNDLAELGLSQQQSNHFYDELDFKLACKITEFCLFDIERIKKAKVNYDPELIHFEDFDITIQILMAHQRAALYTAAAFSHVTMGTNKGGHQAEGLDYRKQIASQAINRMIAKYPGYVTFGDGRLFPEPKIDWKKLKWRMENENPIRDIWL